MLLSRQKQGRFVAPTLMLCAAWHHRTPEASRCTEGFLCISAQKKKRQRNPSVHLDASALWSLKPLGKKVSLDFNAPPAFCRWGWCKGRTWGCQAPTGACCSSMVRSR